MEIYKQVVLPALKIRTDMPIQKSIFTLFKGRPTKILEMLLQFACSAHGLSENKNAATRAAFFICK
jgi:hypothetical protein